MSAITMSTVDKKVPVFSTFLPDYETLNPKLITLIKQYREKYPEREEHTNLRAWRSSYETHLQEDRFDFIIQKGCDAAKCVAKEYWLAPDVHYLPSAFWMCMYEKGEYARQHHHYPSDVSIVYYVDVKDDSAPIVFEDSLTIQPKNGMMLIFPAWLQHRVLETESERIVIAMNLVKKLDIIAF